MRIPKVRCAATVFFVALLHWSCPADVPRPEHPRPDFQRESWLNLNGEWQFELAKAIVAGDNVLAIHCHNTVGGQFIDAGIEVGTELGNP